VKPLSTNFKLPCRQDLSSFWNRAERAIRGLGRSISVHAFEECHLKMIGPVILGEAVWELLSDRDQEDWETFQTAINKRFGLTRQ
jgi:hypothetical protein